MAGEGDQGGQQGGQGGQQGGQQQGGQQQQQQAPWHQGIDADLIGHAQNKGWDLTDPNKAFAAAAKQAREAEKHFGVPPDQIVKLLKPDAKPEEIKAFWSRLGAVEAKDYDLSGIKLNGQDLEASFADAMRGALAAAFVPKDKAGSIVAAVVKHMEDGQKAAAAVASNKLNEEKAALQKNWGEKFNYNHLKAMEAAQRLGPEFKEAIAALEGQVGYAKVMDLFRRIGISGGEDIFVDRGGGPGGSVGPTTMEGAQARLNELTADKAWGSRFLKGDVAAKAEFEQLTRMITPEAA